MSRKIPDPISNPIVSYPYKKLFQTSFYRMHKYWGRKPPNVVAKYIKNYCPKGGVVLDPFLGSGTTAFEAIRTGRKVVGIDINPLAVFITKTTLSPVRLASLEDAFYKVIDEVSEITKNIYKTICPKCKEQALVSFLVHKTDTDDSFEIEMPEKVIYRCKCSKDNLYKDPGVLDIELHNEGKRLAITKWYPEDLILPVIRSGKGEAKTIFDLYTNRNLYLLSEIYSSIIKNSTGMIRNCLLLSFSSSLPQSSRLSGIMKSRRNKFDAMGWILPSFRVMREHVEKNPLETFQLAFNRVLNGKVETNSIFTEYIEGNNIQDISSDNATAYITQGSVDDLPDIIGDLKVNYVFTDPPHGTSIQYLKLSKLSNAWLKIDIDKAPVIEQSGKSKAAELNYLRKLGEAFHNIRKIVNNDVCMHVYQRGKTADWMSSSAAIVSGGFKIKNAIFQPQRYGFRTTYRGRGGVMPLASPPGDWLLHFEPEMDKLPGDINNEKLEDDIVNGLKEIIKKRGQPTRTKYLMANLANKIPSEVYRVNPSIIYEILNKYDGVIFEKTYGDSKKLSEEMWAVVGHTEERTSLDERVEKAIIETLIERDETGASLPFLYQGIYSNFKSLLTPDKATIDKALSKVAEVKKVGVDRRLFLKDEYMEKKERQIELTLILLKIGIEKGFNVYIRPSELERISESDSNNELKKVIQKYPNRLLKEEYFDKNDSEIKESNVLWIKEGYVHAHFEIKYKPDMPEKTIKRGEIIRKRWPESERVIVISHKKKKTLRDTLSKKNSFWHFAPFHSILYSSDPEKTYLPFEATEDRYPAKANPLKLKIIKKQDIVDSDGNIVSFKIMLKCPKDVLGRVRPGHFLKLGINNFSRGKLSKYRPGNDYVTVKNSPNSDHKNLEYFRIPISIHSVYYESFEPTAFKNRSIDFLPGIFWEWLEPGEMKYLDLLIRIAGNGTKTLYKVKKGDTIDAIGPLGKAIKFPPDLETAILVSGGVGLASLYPIAYYFRERGRKVKLFAGAYDKRTLMGPKGKLLSEFNEMGVECHATDEISDKSIVTHLLASWIESEPKEMNSRLKIYACGPWPMLKSVHEISSKNNLSCTVLADKLMLCGIGACMTCVVKCRNKKSGEIEMVRSCLDGPAFESIDIVWD